MRKAHGHPREERRACDLLLRNPEAFVRRGDGETERRSGFTYISTEPPRFHLLGRSWDSLVFPSSKS
ncbi:hypothetical protein EYF80_061049 [Liparis tanakae]|uniref:Uncharacterized protein n=1 Tax=Liparis tanakae TaxID=230148 RepID=A0A4Z2EKC3_9TELE|nr:hypothetical protein EYF80_061049 [Liparis tanakae]